MKAAIATASVKVKRLGLKWAEDRVRNAGDIICDVLNGEVDNCCVVDASGRQLTVEEVRTKSIDQALQSLSEVHAYLRKIRK